MARLREIYIAKREKRSRTTRKPPPIETHWPRVVLDAPIRSVNFHDYLANPAIFYFVLSSTRAGHAPRRERRAEREREEYSDHFGVRDREIVCEARSVIIGPFLLYPGNTGETKRSPGKCRCRDIRDFTVREYTLIRQLRVCAIRRRVYFTVFTYLGYPTSFPNYFSIKIRRTRGYRKRDDA